MKHIYFWENNAELYKSTCQINFVVVQVNIKYILFPEIKEFGKIKGSILGYVDKNISFKRNNGELGAAILDSGAAIMANSQG